MSYDRVNADEFANKDSSQQRILGIDKNDTDITASATTPVLQVVAPADLPEDYVFNAQIGNVLIPVTVPPGGVEKGQQFTVPMPAKMQQTLHEHNTLNLPVGHWRDGMCACWKYGLCHSHCWTAICCPTIAIGQVMSRMNLPWTGRRNDRNTRPTVIGSFQIMLLITIIYGIIYGILHVMVFLDFMGRFDNPYGGNKSAWFPILKTFHDILHYVFVIATSIWIFNLRRTVRAHSAIPSSYDCASSVPEDLVCSLCCTCLVAGQLLRHTTDYGVYPATCCTERGVPMTAPTIV